MLSNGAEFLTAGPELAKAKSTPTDEELAERIVETKASVG
jgi:hypothetical protein